MSLDYYAILGVTSSANTDEIKRSYRALALKWHPDKNPGHEREATEKFKEISEAFSVLSDEKKRRSYDRQGKANTFSDGASEFPRGFPQAPGGFGAFPNDFAAYHRQFTFANAFDIFRTVFGDNPFEHHNNMLRQMEQMHGMHLNAFARAPPPQAAPNGFAAMHSPFANDPFFSALAFPAAPLFPAGGFSSFSSSSSSSSSGVGGFGTQTSTVSSTDALGRQVVKRTVTKRSPDGGVEETTTTQIIRNGQIESEQTESRRTQGQRYLPSPTGTPTHSQLVQQQPQPRVRHIPVIETIDLTQESDSPQHATTLDSQFQQASAEAFPSRSSHTSSSHVSRNTSFPSSYTSSSPSTRLSASAAPFSPATSRPSPAISFAQQNPPRYDFSVHSSSSRSSKF